MARMIQISDGRYIPETDMTPEQVAYYEGRAEHGKNAAPQDSDKPAEVELDGDGVPLEAEGFSEKEKAANRPGETDTGKPETETEKADSETEQGETETEKPETGTVKRDWVEEAYTCFIKDAADIDPTDPVKAIETYFEKNATDELKARCKAEKKTAAMCWKFIEAVARKALHGSSGHIDPAVVYAIAMHWFEDVPGDWEKAAKAARSDTGKAKPKKPTTRKERLEERVSHGSSKAKAELRELKKKERAKAKAKAKKPKQQQGFFFEMLETPAGVGSGGVGESVSGGVGSGTEADASGTEQESGVEALMLKKGGGK